MKNNRQQLSYITMRPFLLLMLLGCIWGTGYSIARYAMTHAISALGYSFWQALGPAALLSMLCVIRKHSLHYRKNWHYYLITSITGIVLPNTTMYITAAHIPAGLLAVIVSMAPIFAYPLALTFRVEIFYWSRLSGVLVGTSGIILIVASAASQPTAAMLPWMLLSLFTPLSFAFSSVYITRYRPTHTHTLPLAAGTLVFASLILLPIIYATHNFHPLRWPYSLADQAILIEIILASAGYLLFFQLLKIAGPIYYGLVDSIVMLTGLLWGYLLFHEQPTSGVGIAIGLTLLALYLVTRQQNTCIQHQSNFPHSSTYS